MVFRARDWSGNTAKAGALGHRERQSDREEATARDHEPHGQRLRSCSGKPDGERSEPRRPKKQYDYLLHYEFYFCHIGRHHRQSIWVRENNKKKA